MMFQGRVFGITLGCLLGMLPLLFIKDEPKPTPPLTVKGASVAADPPEEKNVK